MKRLKLALYAIIILSLAVSCEFAGVNVDFGGGGSSQAQAPSIEAMVDSPANGANLPMGPVDISYHASSTEGVAAVELSINGEVLSSITTPGSDQKVAAMKYTWQPTVSGSHTIRVRAQNNSGTWSDYSATTVNIEAGQEEQAQQTTQEEQPEVVKPTNTPEATATPEGITLFDIKHDKDLFYYGNNTCGSHELTISVRVTNPDDVYQIVLFIKFLDKESAGATKWDSGRALSKKGDDLYSVTLTSTKIPNYTDFEFALMQYQFVVVDKDGNRDVRSDTFEDISIEKCIS